MRMNNPSTYLLRANPALTTNVKLLVDTSYNLYLESYNSNQEISDNQFKKYQINSNSFLSERIASFWKGIPSSLAFQVRNDIKSDTIQTDFANQIDDIYYSGMRQVEDIRYQEEFQYNTTIKIGRLPKWFFIFRIDGPGNVDASSSNVFKTGMKEQMKVVRAVNLTKETEIGKLWQKNYIDDDKLPRSPFELNAKKFEFSKWHGYDYMTGGTVTKSFFMDDFLQAQNTHYEFERFVTEGFQKNGVVCSNYANVSFLFDDTVCGIINKYDGTTATEYDIDKYSFLHDYIESGLLKASDYDLSPNGSMTNFRSVADFSYKKRWTINRYMGFYLDDLVQVTRISPYAGVKMKIDPAIEIVNNQFLLGGVGGTPIDPTVNGWSPNVPMYVKIYKDFYLIELNDLGQYVIVSDVVFNFNASNGTSIVDMINTSEPSIKITYSDADPSLCGYDKINLISYVDDTTYNVYGKSLSAVGGGAYYSVPQNKKDSVHLIKMNGEFYHLKWVNYALNKYGWIVLTDNEINCDGSSFVRLHDENLKETVTTQVLTKNDSIVFFDIYICQFTEIEDWDFNRDSTKYALIEYDNEDEVTRSRPYLHEINYLDKSINRSEYEERSYQIQTYYQKSAAAFQLYPSAPTSFAMPLSSEYGATGDLYVLDKKGDISSIWNINQQIAKWGFYESRANVSYPYKINNSLDQSGAWNFCPNPYTSVKNSQEFSHDWFLTMGMPCDHSLISSLSIPAPLDAQWSYYTLNIQPPFNVEQFTLTGGSNLEGFYKFDIDYYLDQSSTFDLFDYVINTPLVITTHAKLPTRFTTFTDNITRHARFSKSDNVNGPCVFFRGFNAYIEWISLPNPNVIDFNGPSRIKRIVANDLEDYKFSILFDTKEVNQADPNVGKAGIDVVVNKIHENVLIFIYVMVPHKSITNFQYNNRDIACRDEFVTYSYYDQIFLQWMSVNSRLRVNALTLRNLYSILNSNVLESDDFEMGVSYRVVQQEDEFSVSQLFMNYLVSYDPTIMTSTITVQLNDHMFLKAGDWFHLSGVIGINDGNYQISSVDSNNVYSFNISGNYSSLPLTAFANATITGQRSVLPFRLRCLYPEELKIDRVTNQVTEDDTCPVQPTNQLKTISGTLVYDRFYDQYVNNVWIDNPMSRTIQKVKRSKELSFSEISQLPSIFRYSGDYEPISQSMSFFDRSTISCMNQDDSGVGYQSIDDYWTESYNGFFHTVIKYTDSSLNLLDDLKATDLIYLYDPLTPITQPDFHAKLVEVQSIKSKTLVLGVWQYEIIVSLKFGSNLYPQGPLRPGLKGVIFHQVDVRTSFKYDNKNFGITKGLIVAKVHQAQSSPLKTSNPTYNVKNKWAMIDEHGVTTINRAVYQSSWDKKYLFDTAKNIYNSY